MDLNPFNLRGPDFLLFYILMIVIISIAVQRVCSWLEGRHSPQGEAMAMAVARDPYMIAYLRGGRLELLRVAVASLFERGLLITTDEGLQTVERNAALKARRPLDKAILSRFALADAPVSLFDDDVTAKEVEAIGESLELNGLLPDDAVKDRRQAIALCGIIGLWGLGGTKIVIAFTRGHTNVLFLILLAIASTFLVPIAARRSRTGLGDNVWRRVKGLFGDLKRRSIIPDPNRTVSEMTFLAAVFGIGALPAVISKRFREMDLKPPRERQRDWTSWGSSCSAWSAGCGSGGGCGGSSCGGGSCGGGGCGGGCGGCGS